MSETNRQQVFFCRIAWMEKYHGPSGGDTPKGGGSYVDENHSAFEEYNFSYHKGYAYGYVRAKAESKIHPTNKAIKIERINKIQGKNEEQVDGVTVIFFATIPGISKGSVIVGWYKNATVYRDLIKRPGTLTYKVTKEPYLYNLKAKESDAYPVPVGSRVFEIPRMKNRPGQANIFYYRHAARDWIKEVLDYTDSVDNQRK